MSAAAGAAAPVAGPTRLDPIELFLQADIIVQAVMVGLILASIWTWAIIISFSLRIGGLSRKSRDYEASFWDTKDREAALSKKMRGEVPSARVAGAGLDEWKRSTRATPVDRDATRQRIGAAMESQVAAEADDLAGKLNFLATTGSVAPFVGLFGTVWGIMEAFRTIGLTGSTSIVAVAPGISEALINTAAGLFAAIPALLAYNRFSHLLRLARGEMEEFNLEFLNLTERNFT